MLNIPDSQRDTILYQCVCGGWENQYTHDGVTYVGIDRDPALAKAQLFRKLGWDRWQFERADLRRL